MATVPKIRRDQLKADESLCDYCTAKCCRYFALPIDKPDTFSEWEFVRWYLLHEGAAVFKEDDQWYLLVYSTCKHLQSDHRCGIYHTRPQICRDYSTDNCEYDDDWLYEQYLETAEQVWEYAETLLAPTAGPVMRSPKPPVLPIL